MKQISTVTRLLCLLPSFTTPRRTELLIHGLGAVRARRPVPDVFSECFCESQKPDHNLTNTGCF